MKHLWWVISLAIICLPISRASAILGVGDLVFDPAIHFEAVIISGQTTATALNTVEIIANQVLDLMGLEAWILDNSAWVRQLQQTQALIMQAQGLAWDIDSLNAQIHQLFGLEDAPHTSVAYFDRRGEIRRVMWEGWLYAMRVQTLMRTLFSTIDHIVGLYQSIKGLMGNKQGLQSLAQYQATIVQMLTQQELDTSTFNRAKSAEGINTLLNEQSIANLNETVLSDWGLGDNGQ